MEYDQIAVHAETVIAPEFPTVGYRTRTYCDLGIADCKHIVLTQYTINTLLDREFFLQTFQTYFESLFLQF